MNETKQKNEILNSNTRSSESQDWINSSYLSNEVKLLLKDDNPKRSKLKIISYQALLIMISVLFFIGAPLGATVLLQLQMLNLYIAIIDAWSSGDNATANAYELKAYSSITLYNIVDFASFNVVIHPISALLTFIYMFMF